MSKAKNIFKNTENGEPKLSFPKSFNRKILSKVLSGDILLSHYSLNCFNFDFRDLGKHIFEAAKKHSHQFLDLWFPL